jgi:CHASE3 domain sensor protein
MLVRMTPSGLRVPLRWRVLLLLVLLATLNVVFTALTRTEISHVSELDEVGARLVQATRVEEQLQATRDNQALTLHAFALTGELQFLREYQEHRLAAERRHEQLAALLEDEPALLEGAEAVEVAMSTWESQVAAPVIAATPAERARVGARLVGNEGRPLFRRVRDAVDDLVRGLDARQAETTASVQEARTRLNQQLLTMSGLSLLLIAGSVWAIRRWITVPVGVLSSQAKRVAGGDLDAHIDAVGPPEFEEIGHNMERMRRRIVSELRSTTQAFEALEQRAPLVSSLRSLLQTRSATDLPAGLHVSAALEPAHGVLAGDWYDVVRVDEERAVVLVVDVSGHGEEAGLRALWLKHLLVPALRMGLEPGDALTWVSRELGDTEEWFATCVLIEVDTSNGRCLYANAGHPPPLLFGPDGVEELDVTGPLLGPLPRQRWATGQASLDADHLLVVFTDGIVEARDESGDEFGDERLVDSLRSARAMKPDALTEHVMDCVHTFGSERLADDATLAVISFSASDRAADTASEADPIRVS